MQRISRGVESAEPGYAPSPTVLIETHAIPFARRAALYREGIRLVTPSTPRIPPRFLSPRAKTHNYLNLIMGELEAQALDPDSWAVLLDENGNLTEGRGSNIFLVKDGEVSTPSGQFVLERITRGTVLELAAGLGMPASERDLDLYDAYTADEAFLTYLHQPVHLPDIGGQRRCHRRRFGPRASYSAADGSLQRPGRHRLCRAVPLSPAPG